MFHIVTKLRTEALEKTILEISREREFYGYEAHKELLSKGVKIEIGRFYRVLGKMLKEGFLESRWEKSQTGPRRKIYRLGGKGRRELDRILLDAIKSVHSFYEHYMLSLPLKFNPLNLICSYLTEGLKSKETIACVTPVYSSVVGEIVQTLHGKNRQGRIYLISPDSTKVNSKLDGLFLSNGFYGNIPLKEGYVDLLIIIYLPRKNLKTALREWRRVLTPRGRLAVLTPTVLTREYQDPLTIGEFMEKYEHELLEKTERGGKQRFAVLLKNYFRKVEERQFVHVTIFSAS